MLCLGISYNLFSKLLIQCLALLLINCVCCGGLDGFDVIREIFCPLTGRKIFSSLVSSIDKVTLV